MHVDLVGRSARGPLMAISVAVALAASCPGSVHAQPPEPKYDADMLADRQAAIAAVLKAGGEFTADAEKQSEFTADRDVLNLQLVAATKTDILLPKLSSFSRSGTKSKLTSTLSRWRKKASAPRVPSPAN